MNIFIKTVDGLLGDFTNLATRLEAAAENHLAEAEKYISNAAKAEAAAVEHQLQASKAVKVAGNIRNTLLNG